MLHISAIMAGGIYIPLNPDFTDAEVSYYLNDSKPTIFICMPERAESLIKIASESNVPFTYTIGTKDIGTFYEEIYQEMPNSQKLFPEKRRILQQFYYTSGTTGKPKGAMISHRALSSNALILQKEWRFTSQDVLIHALPVFHTHGLFVATNVALVSGAKLIFLDKFDSR